VDYWFGRGAGWAHRACGTVLLLALAVLITVPLLAGHLVSWLNTGQGWSTMALPTGVVVALLILPTVSNVEIGSVKIATLEQTSASEEEGKPSRPFRQIKPAYVIGDIGLTEPEYSTPDQNLPSARADASADLAGEHAQETGQ
jgi:hypothetical protein